ncbi:MAG: hypothetical protein JWO13_1820 [Acidobacteriales bacterium]|nr:hypothetical protein [Terriglobales bacterium]
MRVRDENVVDWWKVFYPQPGLAQALQQEQPLRKVRIDNDVLASGLDEKSRVADEGHADVPVFREYGPVHGADARLHG